MTVHFIGAGPGAPDLITVRGRDLIARCPVCLYAGSLVPAAVVAAAPPGARVIDSAGLTLDAILAVMIEAHARGEDVARVHSGDPSLYGAIGEQIHGLRQQGIPWTITPGVPSFAAAAAALGCELTLPGVAQTVILTRTAQRASPMPNQESLAVLGQAGGTLVLHLSIRQILRVVAELTPLYGPECPAAVVFRASWPDEILIRGTLADIAGKVAAQELTRTALILVGRVLGEDAFSAASALYAATHSHSHRPDPGGGAESAPETAPLTEAGKIPHSKK
mgnify:CR=1 FL=1